MCLFITYPDLLNEYRVQLGKEDLETFVGQLNIDIMELDTTLVNLADDKMSEGCTELPRLKNMSKILSKNFSVSVHFSQCLTLKNEESQWSSTPTDVSGWPLIFLFDNKVLAYLDIEIL